MKVTGETFSFHHKRKRAEEERYQKHPNFQANGPLPDRTLESFTLRSIDGKLLILGKIHTEVTKKTISKFIRRIFNTKEQGNRVIVLFYYTVFFYFY